MDNIVLQDSGTAPGERDIDIGAGVNLPRPGRSLLWLLLFVVLYFLSVVIFGFVAGVALAVQQPELVSQPEKIQQAMEALMGSPSGMAGMYGVQFCLLLPVLFFASRFPMQSYRETLGIKSFSLASLGFWLLVLAAYLLMQIVVNTFVGVESTEFLSSVDNSKNLWLAVVMIVLAPLLEELLFRGYFFRAWRHTRLGLTGTLLLTSVLFAGLHWGQYHWVLLVFLFLFSVILGLARERTGSVWVPIILHAANNTLTAISLLYFGLG